MTSPVRKGPQLCEGETTYLGVFKVFNFFNHIYGGGGSAHKLTACRGQKSIRFPGGKVTGSCELLSIGAGNLTTVVCKNKTHS